MILYLTLKYINIMPLIISTMLNRLTFMHKSRLFIVFINEIDYRHDILSLSNVFEKGLTFVLTLVQDWDKLKTTLLSDTISS